MNTAGKNALYVAIAVTCALATALVTFGLLEAGNRTPEAQPSSPTTERISPSRTPSSALAPMEIRTVELCDLNADGHCDAADLVLFQQALGKKAGEVGYNLSADVDADGVVTLADQQILFPATSPGQNEPPSGTSLKGR